MSEPNGIHSSGKWDVRTGSPRKLWRSLHDFLDENGFAHDYHELRFSESPIEGTATFSDSLAGHKDRQRPSSLSFLRVLLGVILCLTVLLIPAGTRLIRSRVKTVRTLAYISIEGEVFRTKDSDVRNTRLSEVFDLIADARITLDILAGEPSEDSEYEMVTQTEDRGEIAVVRHEYEELCYQVDQLLPGETLPSTALQEY